MAQKSTALHSSILWSIMDNEKGFVIIPKHLKLHSYMNATLETKGIMEQIWPSLSAIFTLERTVQ